MKSLVTDSTRGPEVYWCGMGIDNAHSGIGRVASQLYQRLKDSEFCPVLIAHKPQTYFYPSILVGRFARSLARLKNFNADVCYRYALKAAVGRSAILHGFANYNLPFLQKKRANFKYFITVHDLIPLTHPECVSRAQHQQFKFGFFRAMDRADCILAVSEWTKNSIIQAAPHLRTKIVVLKNGRPVHVPNRSLIDDAQPRDFDALFVGRSEIYKRLELLAQIVNSAPKNWRFCVVTDASGRDKIKILCRERFAAGTLQVLSGISNDELAGIYSRSSCLINTSIVEGFGLPAAEALSLSLPVIWTQGCALDEFCSQEVGIPMSASDSAAAWVEAIESLRCRGISPDKFQKALERIPTWDEAAKQLKLLYAQ